MSISEDEKFSQMIKEYMESAVSTDSCSSCSSHVSLQVDNNNNPTYYFSNLQEILEDQTEAETEVYGKILFYLKDMEAREIKVMNKLKKWVVSRLKMDDYEAHLCKTSWSTPFDCPSVFHFTGEYEYVEVTVKDGNCGGGVEVRLIVDLDFRTQFELARPTANYKEVTKSLPMIFVGKEEKLERLIGLVCFAAANSLTERGLHVPPWRKVSYMKSKWLSKNRKRDSFSEFTTSSSAYRPKINGHACFHDFFQVQKSVAYNC